MEWDINHLKPYYKIVDEELLITTSYKGINFLGLRPQKGNYSLSCEVIPANEMSGIGIYSNTENILALTVNQNKLVLFQIKNGEKEILSEQLIGKTGSINLKYKAVAGRYFHFFWSDNETDWLPVKIGNEYQVDGTFIAQWGYSPRVGFILEGDEMNTYRFSEITINYNLNK